MSSWRRLIPALPLPLRLALVITLIAGTGLWLVVGETIAALRPRFAMASEEALVDTALALAGACAAAQQAGRDPAAELAATLAAIRGIPLDAQIHDLHKTAFGLTVYLTDAAGVVRYHSADPTQVGRDYSKWNDVLRTLRGGYGARATRSDPNDPRTSVLHVAAPVRIGAQLVGVLTVAKPVDAVTPFADTARRDLLLLSALVLAAAALLALAAAAWVAQPLRQLAAHVAAVKAGGSPPLPDLGPGELGALARAFDDLRAALDGRAQVERYVQTVTHEMKGPLAAIAGAAELLAENPPEADRARFIANVRAESARIQGLVDALLQLAALERVADLARQPVPLAALAADLCDGFAPLATQRGVTLAPGVPDGLTVPADRFWLRQALANLLLNALSFAPPGSAVELTARVAGTSVELVVADRGPGIPEWARTRVFERFFSLPRPDTGRRGSGLGLTIAREVALRHGGELTLGEREGGGTEAVLRLPS